MHVYRLSQHSLDIVFKLEAEQRGTETLNIGVVQCDVRSVYLGRDDGEATYQRLHVRVESGSGLEPEERLDLAFLPLMHSARPPVDIVSGALALAQQLPEEQQRQTLAALIGLGQRFLEQGELDALLEGLMATNLGQQLLDRGWAAAKRDDVLKVLAKRFGAVPAALSEHPQQVSDVERLDALLDAALVAQSLEEVVQALNDSVTP